MSVAATPSLADIRATRVQRRWLEPVMHGVLWLCAVASVFVTVSIVLILLVESLGFFRQVSVIEFLTSKQWAPRSEPAHFGILPLFCGTCLVAFGSAIIA